MKRAEPGQPYLPWQAANWSNTSPAELVEATLDKMPNTRRGYGGDLKCFAAWRKAKSVPAAIKRLLGGGRSAVKRTLMAWITAMRVEHLSGNTIRRRIAAVMSLLAMALDLEVIEYSIGRLPLPPAERVRDCRGPDIKVTDQIIALLTVEALRSDIGKRDFCMLHLLYIETFRATESLSIQAADVRGNEVRIAAKRGSGYTAVNVCGATVAALATWLEVRGDAPGPLLLTCPRGVDKAKRKPLTYWSLRGIGRGRFVNCLPGEVDHFFNLACEWGGITSPRRGNAHG